MNEEKPRLARLTSIITILQSQNLTTAPSLAQKFDVSIRTIYRDIRTLEKSGIPIYTVEGKGYSLVSGYNLPPVMFTQDEANALLIAEKIIQNNSDTSLTENYSSAITKIKSILRKDTKNSIEILEKRTAILTGYWQEKTSNQLSFFQNALIKSQQLKIEYHALHNELITTRNIDPLALYNTSNKWLIIAYCHLRNEIREFRLDRILNQQNTANHFKPYEFDLKRYFIGNKPKK